MQHTHLYSVSPLLRLVFFIWSFQGLPKLNPSVTKESYKCRYVDLWQRFYKYLQSSSSFCAVHQYQYQYCMYICTIVQHELDNRHDHIIELAKIIILCKGSWSASPNTPGLPSQSMLLYMMMCLCYDTYDPSATVRGSCPIKLSSCLQCSNVGQQNYTFSWR